MMSRALTLQSDPASTSAEQDQSISPHTSAPNRCSTIPLCRRHKAFEGEACRHLALPMACPSTPLGLALPHLALRWPHHMVKVYPPLQDDALSQDISQSHATVQNTCKATKSGTSCAFPIRYVISLDPLTDVLTSTCHTTLQKHTSGR